MNRTKVMVVDDNAEVRLFFKNVLDVLQYDSVLAENGIEALKLFKAVNPDIVFLDVKMPFIDGIEILNRMRHLDDEKRIPIIMITGYHDKAIARQVIRLGAYDYMSKPLDFESIKLLCEKAELEYEKVNLKCEV